MSRSLALSLLFCVLASSLAFVFRQELATRYEAGLLEQMYVNDDGDAFDPGPRKGSTFPGLHAVDGSRRVTLLQDYAGNRGAVLVVEPLPADSIFTQQLLKDLAPAAAELASADIALIVLLPPERGEDPTAGERLPANYTLLRDVDGLSYVTLGVFNDKVPPGERGFGSPYPGLFVVNAAGRVEDTVFLGNSQQRLAVPVMVKRAKILLGATEESLAD